MKDSEKIGNQDKPSRRKRKLAAIMFTDIVGYTTLMSKDEEKAHKLVQKNRNTLKPLIKQFNGKWLKEVGDGTLSSFESAVEAVRCAIEIQSSLRNDPDLKLRIGIHIGDVVFEAGDVFGHGVNVASRIEPLAEAGCVCISKDVNNRIKNFPDIRTVNLGLKELKNVEEPLEVYEVVTEGTVPAKAVKKALAEQSKVIDSIAVLPFTDMSPQKDQEYFCDGMTEEIINALTKLESLRVVARTSSFVFKDKREDIREIGKKLEVATLLEGSVRKAGNRLRISAQLVNVADGYHLWSERYDRDLEDVFAIQDEISLAIVDKLKVKLLTKEKAKLVKRYTDNLEAYNLYLKGRFFWNKRTEEGFKKSLEYFQQAIDIDPTYTLAYAGIADCYNLLGWYGYLSPKEAFPRAKVAAEKALEMDDSLAEAHTSLANFRANYDWDWLGAEREYKRAIQLNPNYITAHQWYAEYLAAMGRHDESIAEAKRALELDPLSLIMNTLVGLILYEARQYVQAIKQLQKTLEMDPNFVVPHFFLAFPYVQKTMYNEAIAEIQKAMNLSGGDDTLILAQLGATYSYSGNRDEAGKILDELYELSKQRYVSPFYVALIHIGLGQKSQALEWLEKAYEGRDHWLENLKVDPMLDSLRSDPRFTALLKKVGLGK